VRVWQRGPGRSILEAQAERGFPHLGESELELILESKKKPIPEQDVAGLHRKTDLQMACMQAMHPEWDDAAASVALNKAFLEDNPDTYEELALPACMMGEVVTANEAKEVAKYSAALSQIKVLQKHVHATRAARTRKYFKKAAAPKYKVVLRKKPRWVAAPDAQVNDVTEWINKHMPDFVHIHTDEVAGRWRVIGPELNIKSIAWTKRGWKDAAMETLYRAWQFHTDHTGNDCPFGIDALEHEFETVAAIA